MPLEPHMLVAIGVVLVAVLLCYLASRNGRKDDDFLSMPAPTHIVTSTREPGCLIEAHVKKSSDDRWRVSVQKWKPEPEEPDFDWISTGDGFESTALAIRFIREYWPDAVIFVPDPYGKKQIHNTMGAALKSANDPRDRSKASRDAANEAAMNISTMG